MSEWEDDIQRLVLEGYNALEVADLERALQVSRELYDHRHTASFEIEARARWEMGDTERAIEVLQEGTERAPEIFTLWDYLGSYLSDEERYDEALAAYYRAREAENAPVEAVDFNIAIIYQRQDRHERALALLDTVTPSEELPEMAIEGSKAYSLNELGKHSDALAKSAAMLSSIQEEDDVEPESVARLMSEHAYALWVLGVHEAAYLEANEAVALDKTNRRASWLIREILDEHSSNSKAWRIIVRGRWAGLMEDSDEDYGFFATYIVVADAPEETLEYIRAFEPEEVRFTLEIESAIEVEDKPDVPMGVYEAAPGYTFYRLTE